MYEPLTSEEAASADQECDTGTWTPAVPPPTDVLPTFTHFKLGEPVGKWPYHNADGELEGYQCRFNTVGKDGKAYKEFFPRRYGVLNGKEGWHWKG